MASITYPYRKKKKHIFRNTVIILILALLVAPIALVFYFFYDASTSSFVRDPNFQREQSLNIISVDSLDNTKSTGLINYSIPEDMFNNLIAEGFDMAGGTVNSVVKKVAMDFKGNQYILSAEFDIYQVFKTRIYVYTSLGKEVVDDEIQYIFKIDNVVFGKSKNLFGITKPYFQQYLNDDVIKNVFGAFGFNVTPDLAHDRVIYKEKDLLKDMSNLLGNEEENGNTDRLFFSILNEYLDRDAFSFDFETEGQIGGNIDISNSNTNESYCSPEKLNDWHLDDIRDNAITVMNSGVMDDPSKADVLLSYLINGHDRSSTETNSFISELDLSKLDIGIDDYLTYNGIELGEKVDILLETRNDSNERADSMLSTGIVARIPETLFDNAIKTQSLVGHSYTLCRETEPGKYKINYIVFDNFYTNITDGHIYFIANLNINGYNNSIVLDATEINVDAGDFKIRFTIDDIYYGNKKAGPALKSVLYDLMTKSVKDENWVFVEFDDEHHEMIIDISQGIDQPIKDMIALHDKHVKMRVSGQEIDSEGYLEAYIEL